MVYGNMMCHNITLKKCKSESGWNGKIQQPKALIVCDESSSQFVIILSLPFASQESSISSEQFWLNVLCILYKVSFQDKRSIMLAECYFQVSAIIGSYNSHQKKVWSKLKYANWSMFIPIWKIKFGESASSFCCIDVDDKGCLQLTLKKAPGEHERIIDLKGANLRRMRRWGENCENETTHTCHWTGS